MRRQRPHVRIVPGAFTLDDDSAQPGQTRLAKRNPPPLVAEPDAVVFHRVVGREASVRGNVVVGHLHGSAADGGHGRLGLPLPVGSANPVELSLGWRASHVLAGRALSARTRPHTARISTGA
jgi:hypothetical protein